ncbi:MAG: ABC transporter ATP-binding protein/permease [Blautia sp.]|nr:ABC transporter ATP-binding protein/permease [Blautia sp.]
MNRKKKSPIYLKYVLQDCFRAFPGMMVLIVLMEIVQNAVTVLAPVILAEVVEGAAAGAGRRVVPRIVLFACFLLAVPLFNSVYRWMDLVLTVRSEQYFGRKMFAFSKQIQLEALEDTEVLDRFKKAERAMQNHPMMSLVINMVALLGQAAACAGIMVVVGSYSPWLPLIALAGVIPSLLAQVYGMEQRVKLRRGQSAARRKVQYLWELFTRKEAIKEMRTMGFAAYLKEKWSEENIKLVKELQEVVQKLYRKSMVADSVVNLFYALNIAVTLYLMVKGQISVGEFAACLMAFAGFQGGLRSLVGMIVEITDDYRYVEDYYDYFTIPAERDGTDRYRPFRDEIRLEDVTFRYRGAGNDALKGVNCSIAKGEHVVIVGENGSGKTTLSRLLTGAYLPRTGEISYDGQRTSELDRKSLYEHISVVPQDFVHYQFTLRENVGISDISRMQDGKAMEALLGEVAGAEFLKEIGGLDMQLGREFGGRELSGGEWQKVAIARGLWKDSDIIILDEPTSALDPLVEYDILSKFKEMIRDKTSIIISHRVGMCRSADKIIVMKEGRVAECGKHEQLLALNGEYSRIWEEQAKWYV